MWISKLSGGGRRLAAVVALCGCTHLAVTEPVPAAAPVAPAVAAWTVHDGASQTVTLPDRARTCVTAAITPVGTRPAAACVAGLEPAAAAGGRRPKQVGECVVALAVYVLLSTGPASALAPGHLVFNVFRLC